MLFEIMCSFTLWLLILCKYFFEGIELLLWRKFREDGANHFLFLTFDFCHIARL